MPGRRRAAHRRERASFREPWGSRSETEATFAALVLRSRPMVSRARPRGRPGPWRPRARSRPTLPMTACWTLRREPWRILSRAPASARLLCLLSLVPFPAHLCRGRAKRACTSPCTLPPRTVGYHLVSCASSSPRRPAEPQNSDGETQEPAGRRRVLVERPEGIAAMDLVFVTSECEPYSKSGGLADVMGSLPEALAARGHRVMVVTPRCYSMASSVLTHLTHPAHPLTSPHLTSPTLSPHLPSLSPPGTTTTPGPSTRATAA